MTAEGPEPTLAGVRACVLEGRSKLIVALVQGLLDRSVRAEEVLNAALLPGMAAVGEMMRTGQLYLPEVLQSAGAMKAAMDLLKPHLLRGEARPSAKILLGTVRGDIHDIGKNLVGIMMRGAGFEVVDAGVQVSPPRFVEAVREHRPDIVGLSAMLTTTMANMKPTIDALESAGLRQSVRVLVGGAPVSRAFAEGIGADGYAPDAVRAVTEARGLLALPRS